VWKFDEVAHAGREHLDPAYVAGYDRKARTDWALEVQLLSDLGLDRRSLIVDMGAGTGGLALAVAPFCERVIAVDVSPAMLDVLRTSAERLELQNVECVQAGFLSYEHKHRLADFVYSRNALHHPPDQWKVLALERMPSILRQGGVLRLRDLVFSFDPADAHRVIERWLAAAPERAEQGWTRAELEVHLAEEYSTFDWLLEAMLERAGFRIEGAERDPSQVFAAYVCRRA
jgi:SAM-dependent methyltransferase